jgi:drug/metabolite transporter (DMT)-like permease
MARFTIVIGLLLTLLGVGFYFAAFMAGAEGTNPSPTALIPAFLGVPILLFGCVALKESLRMHAMHVVALLSLLGFLLPAGRLGMKLAQGETPKTTILVSLVLMAALCGILLAGCVRSFVQARLRLSK